MSDDSKPTCELWPNGRAKSPMRDGRDDFGKQPDIMEIPMDEPWGERREWIRLVIFSNPRAGYAHDRLEAEQYLLVGRVYETSRIEVSSSSSRVEFKDFPGNWFNTVLFADWGFDLK